MTSVTNYYYWYVAGTKPGIYKYMCMYYECQSEHYISTWIDCDIIVIKGKNKVWKTQTDSQWSIYVIVHVFRKHVWETHTFVQGCFGNNFMNKKTYKYNISKIVTRGNFHLFTRFSITYVSILCCIMRNGDISMAFNPFQHNKILGQNKLKSFANDKLNVAKMIISVFDRVENVGKGEIACTSHFSSSHNVFKKVLS